MVMHPFSFLYTRPLVFLARPFLLEKEKTETTVGGWSFLAFKLINWQIKKIYVVCDVCFCYVIFHFDSEDMAVFFNVFPCDTFSVLYYTFLY